jgi:hypothetical protein
MADRADLSLVRDLDLDMLSGDRHDAPGHISWFDGMFDQLVIRFLATGATTASVCSPCQHGTYSATAGGLGPLVGRLALSLALCL